VRFRGCDPAAIVRVPPIEHEPPASLAGDRVLVFPLHAVRNELEVRLLPTDCHAPRVVILEVGQQGLCLVRQLPSLDSLAHAVLVPSDGHKTHSLPVHGLAQVVRSERAALRADAGALVPLARSVAEVVPI